MNPFEKIVGYFVIRRELTRIADTLKNPDRYARLGVSAPRGLLLYGPPGVGKTLMASCLLEAGEREVFLCRKDQPDGKFVDTIRDTFERATRAAPSVVFLDDLDKFANNDEDHPDSEEFVTVQSCIDAAKHAEVFVLATANCLKTLPGSLTRAGRFDRVIEVGPPEREDATRIITHYLRGKTCVAEADPGIVAELMPDSSCAELETAINEAGLLAGYEHAEKISMRHLALGCLSVAHRIAPDSVAAFRDGKTVEPVARHEAGHALVSELLFPGSVSCVCLHRDGDAVCGLTVYSDRDRFDPDSRIKAAVVDLAGRAAVKQSFGRIDLGSGSDIRQAREKLIRLAEGHAAFGFHLIDPFFNCSDEQLRRKELVVADRLRECCERAERLLAEHRAQLDALAEALLQKGLLLAPDVRRVLGETAA